MGKSGSLGANPADAFRKKMQEREAKRNKEVREKMREASWVSKDTAKMERKIEQYRKIVRVRKMTDAEKEKLQSMEAELKDVREKQKAAGITFKKREAADQTAGYDPLAAAEMRDPGYARAGTSALLEEDEYSDSDDNDVIDTAMLGQIVSLDQEEWNASATVLAAEPQVRNLKKELTNLVPAALARKSKNKERQQVLAAVPLVPRMVVNAAPDIDAGPGSSPGLSIGPSTGILGAMRPVSGVRFSAHAVAPPESSQATLNAKPSQQGAKSRKDPSLDDEYQRFIKQMDGLL
ncbi:hypothetical protein GGI04_002973 [Coemansia thaxteri]|nr:hypothetical protein GGI04_002973 [Coemansia thaxteri]KAJ2471576.1 hypothetical protein GGI02_002176 [Coemansia sp. RSA 2322]KAJ2486411.1 hypothetical protein EV174_001119 [Coemansia sp. RSA 2320]